ncbi:MAG: DUF2029 domain-containing protein [Chloroflexi bacterium]|nr:DUF2029 domain-containing protein [Chloroflexota bacterium]
MHSKPINAKFVFTAAVSLSLLIVYVAQWVTMIANPSLRTGTDFMAFYAAGRAVDLYGYSEAYNLGHQKQIQEEVLGFPIIESQTLPYLHPPYLLPLISMWMTQNYIASFLRWMFLFLLIYAMSSFLLISTLSPAKPGIVFGTLLFFPFFQSLLLGQDTALLYAGVILWFYGIDKKNDWTAGIGLALTSIRPHLLAVFALSLLFINRGAIWRFFLAVGILGLFSLVLIRWDGMRDFLLLIQISASGEGHGTNEASMLNLIGLTARLLPGLQPETIRAVGWAGYAVGVGASYFVWRRDDFSLQSKVGLCIILALFFSPHLHYHDLTLLIIPLLFLSQMDKTSYQTPLVVSFSLLIFKPLYYVLPYLLYAALIWGLVKRQNKAQGREAGIPLE